MNQQNSNYKPPIARWVNVVRHGRLLCRFDHIRGVLEIQNRGEMEVIDLASEVERHEQAKEVASVS